jgi:glycosyltransferase involved in cell wall biosynthesis
LKRRHEVLGIGFEKLYPRWLFPGEGELETDPLPDSGEIAQPILHFAKLSRWRDTLVEIQKFSPACVVLTWWVPFWALHTRWLARRLTPGCPVVFLCHNVIPHESHWFDARMVRMALRTGNRFIVHSEDNRSELMHWFPEARVVRREHPIYRSDVAPELSRDEARTKLGVSGKMLLFFGFVRRYKGLDIAIEAMAQVRADLTDLQFRVCGEFWEDEARYRHQIRQLGLEDRIAIESGYMSEAELSLRLAACDGVVLPYRSATGSGVLANAYSVNRPVIATRTGCFKEMVLPGETGLLAEPGDVKSLANAYREFYAGEGPDRFVPGLEQVGQRFTWDAIVDAIEELASDG